MPAVKITEKTRYILKAFVDKALSLRIQIPSESWWLLYVNKELITRCNEWLCTSVCNDCRLLNYQTIGFIIIQIKFLKGHYVNNG